ncbi:restriction endonuclease subunit S [Micromonospora sp. C28SCA-DRY-2]|uniref:restriction endonuclease subunit S n=1 Tax=Micromonospora sp. C28SCA-DRY-2 TaxID=3059522 RepID=UPI002675D874|nr:restriction endonuclease subunit S [Micromonospora sp. C28SCA-DRY-2]MDO3704713.1 restriction endonuclease subunit S [Micromonospora sp. C28SCA-DRY-2]
MTDLPQGWTSTTLGELGRYINGRGFKKSEWAEKGRPIIRIQNLTKPESSHNYYSGPIEDRYIVKDGDLLVSWAATLGAFLWRGPEAVLNQHIFRVESFIEKKFHYYLIESLLADLMRVTHGSGIVHVTRGKFDNLEVKLPPLAEQRRIVDVLDGEVARLDRGRQLLGQAEARLERFRSLMTERLFGSKQAEQRRLASLLAEKMINGRSVPTLAGGFPVLRLTALQAGRINLAERKEGDWGVDDAQPYLVRRGDFLVSRGNGSLRLVGLGGLVEDEPDAVAFPDTLIRVRVDPSVVRPRYLALTWNSPQVRRQIEGAARTTAGIYKINQAVLGDVLLPVPDPIDQDRIINEWQTVVGEVERLRGVLRSSVRRAWKLRSSLLAEAFAGRLVPQDPSDEPASELLARIRAEREAALQKQKTPYRRTRKELLAPPIRVTGGGYQQEALPL